VQEEIPGVDVQAEGRRCELNQCTRTGEADQPAKPGCNCTMWIWDAGEANTIADTCYRKRDDEEESWYAPAKRVGDPDIGATVVDVPADSQIGPDGTKKNCISKSASPEQVDVWNW